jgi:cytoskeletal protein CcmA (bactofilin family)
MAKPEESRSNDTDAAAFSDRTSRLGASTVMQGEISSSEDLVLQGVFKGRITLTGARLTIDQKAEVEAEIAAAGVAVHGVLTGNIRATGRVTLAASAHMNGNITAARISIHDGARFRGALLMKSGDA